MNPDEPIVHVVDDDPAVRESLKWMIESGGFNVATYDRAKVFLDTYDPNRFGCVVADVRMPGISGLELQEQLAATDVTLPVIIISGCGDVPIAVRAMRAGAVDFIEKPFDDQFLLTRIREAVEKNIRSRRIRAKRAEVETKMARLTPRETEVMGLVDDGHPNKRIAADLGISMKTVEAHRARVMDKMQADSLATLVRLAESVRDDMRIPARPRTS